MPVTVYGRSIEGLHLSRYGGLTIRIIPGTLHAWTEIEMAPEDGGSPGNPDTAFAERIGLLEPGAASMPLRLPDGLWFFRARHFGEGKNTSGWTAWINGTAEDLPDDPYDTVLRTAGVEEPLTSGGGTFPHDINLAANHSNFPLDIDRGGTGVSAGVDDQFYYFDAASPTALQVLVVGTNEIILGTSPPTSGPLTSAYTTGTFAPDSHAYSVHSGNVPSSDVVGSYASITGVGTLTAGTWEATAVASNFGGTGLTNASFASGDIIYSVDGTSWTVLTWLSGSDGQVLTRGDGTPILSWEDQVISGTIGPDSGGTGVTNWSTFENSLVVTGPGAAGNWTGINGGNAGTFLEGQGAETAPVFSAITAADIAAGTFGGSFTFSSALIFSVDEGIHHTDAVSLLRFSGGSSSSNGANIALYGGTHASRADDFAIRSGTSEIISWDDNIATLFVQPGTGSFVAIARTAGSPDRGYLAVTGGLYSTEYSHGNRGAATTCFGRSGNQQHMIMTASLTITVTLEVDGQYMDLYVQADSGGPYTITWAGVDNDADAIDNTVAALTTNHYHLRRSRGNTVKYHISTDVLGVL